MITKTSMLLRVVELDVGVGDEGAGGEEGAKIKAPIQRHVLLGKRERTLVREIRSQGERPRKLPFVLLM